MRLLAWSRCAVASWLLLAAIGLGAQAVSKARKDADALVRAVLPMAQELLRARGEFAPFGARMNAAREVEELANADERERRPAGSGSELRERLETELKSGNILATALVYEARLTTNLSLPTVDAIAISVIHRHGYSAIFAFPYRFTGGQLKLGDVQIVEQHGDSNVGRAKRAK